MKNQVQNELDLLRKKRARGSKEEVVIGVKLRKLLRAGEISQAQYNYVMGIAPATKHVRLE